MESLADHQNIVLAIAQVALWGRAAKPLLGEPRTCDLNGARRASHLRQHRLHVDPLGISGKTMLPRNRLPSLKKGGARKLPRNLQARRRGDGPHVAGRLRKGPRLHLSLPTSQRHPYQPSWRRLLRPNSLPRLRHTKSEKTQDHGKSRACAPSRTSPSGSTSLRPIRGRSVQMADVIRRGRRTFHLWRSWRQARFSSPASRESALLVLRPILLLRRRLLLLLRSRQALVRSPLRPA